MKSEVQRKQAGLQVGVCINRTWLNRLHPSQCCDRPYLGCLLQGKILRLSVCLHRRVRFVLPYIRVHVVNVGPMFDLTLVWDVTYDVIEKLPHSNFQNVVTAVLSPQKWKYLINVLCSQLQNMSLKGIPCLQLIWFWSTLKLHLSVY